MFGEEFSEEIRYAKSFISLLDLMIFSKFLSFDSEFYEPERRD